LKLAVFQIGIVNHLADFLRGSVINSKTLEQRFERAVVAMMRKFHVGHVKGSAFANFSGAIPKTNFGFASINFRISHAEPTRSIPAVAE